MKFLICFLTAITCCSCSMKRIVSPAIDKFSRNFEEAFYQQKDPDLAREGGASFLIILDAMIKNDPSNTSLLLKASQAYSAYASAFVVDDNKTRAHILFERARDYSFSALKTSKIKFDPLNKTLDQWDTLLNKTKKEHVPLLFQTANAWSGWIVTHPNSSLALADFSIVLHIMDAVLRLDDTHQKGAVHLFYGIYLTSKPAAFGGDLEKARLHFETAMTLAGDDALLPRVLFAKYYAYHAMDEALFDQLLSQVLNAPDSEDVNLNLMNAIAKIQAQKLKEDKSNLF